MEFNPEKEVILRENKFRYTVFPVEHNDLWTLYKISLANFWVVNEVDLSKDNNDWDNKLTNNEKFFIKNVLAFFAGSDGIVNENLVLNFYNEIQLSEARQIYAVQITIEAIHNHMYSLLIDSYIKDRKEKDQLFKAIEFNPAVKKKADWALKWITNGTFPERLLAFILVEGVFFSGSFCSIFWLKQKGLMPGLTFSNEFISRDEALHCLTGIMLYNKLNQRLSEEKVHNICKEAVSIEKEFITESLPVSLIGMNADLMKQYIEYVCDFYLVYLNYSKIYNKTNPFPFMEYISMETKSNFFEAKNASYQKAGVATDEDNYTFSLTDDF